MFIAVNTNGEKIAGTDANKNDKYLCPICHEEVIYRKCKTKASHFAHKVNSECDDWGDMSEWHLGWQEKFPIECREVVMEKDGIKHRADIFIKERNVVIEFQHSQISNEDFNARNKFYTGCGYDIIWIFDGDKKIKKPDKYECDFNKIHNIYDFIDQTLEWKRCKKTEELLRTDIKFQLYYEVYMEKLNKKVLLPLHKFDEYELKFYWLYDYIYEDCFLKSYSKSFSNSDAKSIEQILFETQQFVEINEINKKLKEIQTIRYVPSYYSRPIRRKFRF